MKNTEIQERILRPAHGIPVLILELVLIAVSLLLMIGGVVLLNWSPVFGVAAIVVGPILLIADCICFAGLKSVRPNEALVLTLFGSYHGTVKEPGFYFVNPFCSAVSPAYDKAAAEAGIVVEEVRITHLAYAEEIAAAMLQRQQAAAIIAARQKIVDGAVGMVKMAIDRLGEDEVVVLDEERKAAMVSNLLVVLCGNRDAQPVVNSGSIY